MLGNIKLGCLEKIELRDVWQTEDRHFTPWLAQADNMAILADTLGMELEVEAEEKDVGPFRADILCKDSGDDSWVLIENQLERTDHKHLGQLLTYAAGLRAVTIIWIACNFTEEHKASLDWLNRVTDDSIRFFGLEVELWRIGESIAAPKFNIVSMPNEWSRSVDRASKQLSNKAITETQMAQVVFWTDLSKMLEDHHSLRAGKPRPKNWMNFSIGHSGMILGVVMNTHKNRIGVELYFRGEDASAYYNQLLEDKNDIEQELQSSPEWKPLPNQQACRIILYLDEVNPLDENQRQKCLLWMIEQLENFDRVFRPRVKFLNAKDYVIPLEANGFNEAEAF